MSRKDEDEKLLLHVQRTAAYVFVGLVAVVVILDRFGPSLLPDYEPVGDTALGLLIGAALVFGGVRGIEAWRELRK